MCVYLCIARRTRMPFSPTVQTLLLLVSVTARRKRREKRNKERASDSKRVKARLVEGGGKGVSGVIKVFVADEECSFRWRGTSGRLGGVGIHAVYSLPQQQRE